MSLVADMSDEKIIQGWSAIAEMFDCSVRKMQSYRKELRDGGFIFYKNMGLPPRLTVCAFPSSLKRWIAIKSAKGEIF